MTTNEEKIFEQPIHTQFTEISYEKSKPDYCSRHPDKKARYSLCSIGDKKEKLCSKCALNEALKAGKVDFELSTRGF